MQRCKLGIWDTSVPRISFDEEGISNYARIQQTLMRIYPRGMNGKEEWEAIVRKVNTNGKHKKYNCIVGVSGGVDSSYLLYLMKHVYKLRPLAVTLDNGWNTEIAVKNIKLITDALKVDLETYVINYEEIKDLLRSYMFANLPWIDTPTDTAIKSVMYKIALDENIKYIFRGNDFRTEGKQPRDWTYSDAKQLKYIHKKYGKIKRLKTYPYLTFSRIIYASIFRRIKDIRPFYYLDYSKNHAREFLEKKYNWRYYGGHHHENLFTKFVMSYWLPEKFNIDKRLISLSAQILSNDNTREESLKELKNPPASTKEKENMVQYVKKKLELSDQEFDSIMAAENKNYTDYPNYEKLLSFILRFFRPLIKIIFVQKPMTFIEMDIIREK